MTTHDTVSAPAGRFRGRSTPHGMCFLGLPYARSPHPGHAFDAPVPHVPEPLDAAGGVVDATQAGASASRPRTGPSLFPEPVVAGANCLNLNVYTPAPDAGARPVLVWIHGGGFVTGCNASPWYDGDAFARDGVVLVAVNYRLGSEGFLLADDAPANRALLDLIAALRWVSQNIAAFGGDPSKVTVAGQSAGAMASLMLLCCPAARGLLNRVAAISPASPMWCTRPAATQVAKSFSAELGVAPLAGELDGVELAQRLAVEQQWMPAGMIPDRGGAVTDSITALGGSGLNWLPVLDGDVVTTDPMQALADSPVDALLIGSTTQEWNFVVPPEPVAGTSSALDAAYDAALANLGVDAAGEQRYRDELGTQSRRTVVGQALSDRVFRRPVRDLADASAAARPTFAYQFGWESQAIGAGHCADLPFFFDNLAAEGAENLLGSDAPQALASAMHGALVDFVRTGSPPWAPYDTRYRRTMVFGADSAASAASAVSDDPFGTARPAPGE